MDGACGKYSLSCGLTEGSRSDISPKKVSDKTLRRHSKVCRNAFNSVYVHAVLLSIVTINFDKTRLMGSVL